MVVGNKNMLNIHVVPPPHEGQEEKYARFVLDIVIPLRIKNGVYQTIKTKILSPFSISLN